MISVLSCSFSQISLTVIVFSIVLVVSYMYHTCFRVIISLQRHSCQIIATAKNKKSLLKNNFQTRRDLYMSTNVKMSDNSKSKKEQVLEQKG